ncbi:MAG: MATE family efflux transporter [Bacteroidota bacterium]
MSLADQQKTFILTAPLPRVMVKLALPAIAAMVLYGLNAFMDTVYIGQLLDETALTGVALAYPLTSILLGLGSWTGTGAANLLSIALGSNDQERQQKLLANSTLLGLILTVLFAVPAYIFATPLIQMMGGAGDILTEGVTYFRITMLAAPLWVYGLSLNLVIRGEGKMKTAAIMMSFGLIVNLILTPIFITQFNMGVEGAAWATNIGMLIYCLAGYWYFQSGRASFEANISSLKYDKDVFQAVLKSGFPGFIITVMGLIQALVVFRAIVQVGDADDLAFFAAANRILLFLMTPLFGLMRALQPIAGINYGAADFVRVKSSFMLFVKTGFYLVVPFWIFLSLFPELSLRMVLPDMRFTAQDFTNLRIYMLVLPILPIIFMALTFFPAIEEEKYGSLLGLARQLVFYLPIMLVLPRFFGVEWVYYASTIIDVIITVWGGLILYQLFRTKLNTSSAEFVSRGPA